MARSKKESFLSNSLSVKWSCHKNGLIPLSLVVELLPRTAFISNSFREIIIVPTPCRIVCRIKILWGSKNNIPKHFDLKATRMVSEARSSLWPSPPLCVKQAHKGILWPTLLQGHTTLIPQGSCLVAREGRIPGLAKKKRINRLPRVALVYSQEAMTHVFVQSCFSITTRFSLLI